MESLSSLRSVEIVSFAFVAPNKSRSMDGAKIPGHANRLPPSSDTASEPSTHQSIQRGRRGDLQIGDDGSWRLRMVASGSRCPQRRIRQASLPLWSHFGAVAVEPIAVATIIQKQQLGNYYVNRRFKDSMNQYEYFCPSTRENISTTVGSSR